MGFLCIYCKVTDKESEDLSSRWNFLALKDLLFSFLAWNLVRREQMDDLSEINNMKLFESLEVVKKNTFI